MLHINNNTSIMRKLFLTAIIMLTMLPAVAQVSRQDVITGVEKSNSQVAAHDWSGAFATLRALDSNIGAGNPALHYLVTKQRCVLYSRINRSQEVKQNIGLMEQLANQSGDNATIEDMLLFKAKYCALNNNQQGAAVYARIFINRRTAGKNDSLTDEAFKASIAQLQKQNMKPVANVISRIYTDWQDSIAAARKASAYSDLQRQYAQAQQDIADRDSNINVKWGIIIFLSILAIALAAALAFFIFMFLRNNVVTRRLRRSLDIANTSSEKKSFFIRNISRQMAPSLQQIASGNGQKHITALQTMLSHAEEYISQEDAREQKLDKESVNMSDFCKRVAAAIAFKGEPVKVEAQSLSFPINEEATETIITRVANELALRKGTERLTLAFKKRTPKSGQFVITAIGAERYDDDADTMFTAFSKIYDLTLTDGLLLPISALMAYRMDAQLTLDQSFAKGVRVLLDIHI